MSNQTDDLLATCAECKEEFSTEEQGQYSSQDEEWVCDSCFESDTQYASLVQIFPAGGGADQETLAIHVSDRFQLCDDGFDHFGSEPTITRTWVSTDAWRGHNETSLAGWSEVLGGWTTGGWDDPLVRRKQLFNGWVTELCEGSLETPCDVALITDMTSNLFSTAITIAVKDEDVETFKNWLGEDLGALADALK